MENWCYILLLIALKAATNRLAMTLFYKFFMGDPNAVYEIFTHIAVKPVDGKDVAITLLVT